MQGFLRFTKSLQVQLARLAWYCLLYTSCMTLDERIVVEAYTGYVMTGGQDNQMCIRDSFGCFLMTGYLVSMENF